MKASKRSRGPRQGNQTAAPKRPSPLRTLIGRCMLVAGALMIGVAVTYEALNYPWQTLGVKDRPEWHDPESVPDPTLDPYYIVRYPSPTLTPFSPPPGEASPASPREPAQDSPPPQILPGQGDSIIPPAKEREIPPDIGIIKIPKLKVSEFIYEDATLFELKLGVGHVLNTAGLGQAGNLCLAGHRSTASKHPFRYLDLLAEGDMVVIKDKEKRTYIYTVYEQFIIAADQFNVLYEVPGEPYCLTLITCHPYGFQTHRLIVRARLTEADGLPPEAYDPSPSPSPSGDASDLPSQDGAEAPGSGG